MRVLTGAAGRNFFFFFLPTIKKISTCVGGGEGRSAEGSKMLSSEYCAFRFIQDIDFLLATKQVRPVGY